jgi:iron complex outermembrane receptor protein
MNPVDRISPIRPLAVAILSALASWPALAQTPLAEDDTVRLDTVTVTAQRRTEDVKDVPISITTVADEKLDVIGSGGEDVRFLSGRLPSLIIESSFGRTFPRFYIRGYGNTDFDLNASQPVSVVYDEIVQESPIIKGFPVFDLDRVELLRGPQGTLFGRNTPAGVIKFDSRQPSQEADGYARVGVGRFSTLNFEGAIGGGLSETVSMRVSALYQSRDDYVDNQFEPGPESGLEGYDDVAARAQLLFENEGTRALFNLHGRNLSGSARAFRANIIRAGSNDFVPGFDRYEVFHDGENTQDVDTFGANARLSFELGSLTLHSITGYESAETYSRGDIDGGFGAVFLPSSGPGLIPFSSESADGLPDHSQFTQEFRLESNEWGAFDWQGGLFWFDEDLTIDSFSYDSLSNNVENGSAQQEQNNEAWAAFFSGEFEVNERFVLRAGVRYTQDEKDFVAERFQSPLAFLGVGPLPPVRVSTDADDISWDLSGVYQLSDASNLFFRVAEGFRAPAIQGRVLFGDVVSVADSETVLSWEAGIKTDFFENRARASFSVFHYTVDDQQLTAVGGTQNFNTLVNADKSVGQGFELDVEAYVTDSLLVTLGASYNDTEIQDDGLAIAPCGGGCTVNDPDGPVAGTVLIDGNPLPNAPKWITNFTARYSVPMGAGEFFVYTDWAYRGEVNFFLYESTEFRGEALLEGGLRVGYNWNYGAYELAAFGRNITDEEVIVGGIDFNNLTGFLNEPRIWGVEFKAGF